MSWDYAVFEVYCGLTLKRASCQKTAPFDFIKGKFVRVGPWKGGRKFTVKFQCPITPKEQGCNKCFSAVKVKSRRGTVPCPWVCFADISKEFHLLNVHKDLWRKQTRANKVWDKLMRVRKRDKLPNLTTEQAEEMWKQCQLFVGDRKNFWSTVEKEKKS